MRLLLRHSFFRVALILKSIIIRDKVLIFSVNMTAMTIERAVDSAIVSTEMEGFAITEKHKELIMKLMKKEITLEEALKELNKKG